MVRDGVPPWGVGTGGSRDHRRGMNASARLWLVAPATAVGAAFAWWASTRPPFTFQAHASVFAAAGTLWMVAARAGPPVAARGNAPASIAAAGLLGWGALVAGAVGFELFNYFQHPRADHPTMSSLINEVDVAALRPALFLGWLALGWHLARR